MLGVFLRHIVLLRLMLDSRFEIAMSEEDKKVFVNDVIDDIIDCNKPLLPLKYLNEFVGNTDFHPFISYANKIASRSDNDIKKAVNDWCNDTSDNKVESVRKYGHISEWHTSRVTDMNGLFEGKNNFNDDISNWNVSSVTNMASMFEGAENFNQDISNWDVSNVTNMASMFRDCFQFNNDDKPLNWDVSNVTNMQSMFEGAKEFNIDITCWDITNVKNMYSMFYRATNFEIDISGWNLSNKNIREMLTNTMFNI